MLLPYNTKTFCFCTFTEYNCENGPNMDIYRASWTAHITMGLTDVMSGCYDISHNTDQRSAV